MFKLYLINNTTITEDKCKWKFIPNIPIVKLEYLLPNKKILVLSGFEKYCVIKEKIEGVNKKFFSVSSVNILAKYNNDVYQFTLSYQHHRACQRKNKWGKDFSAMILNPITNDISWSKAQKININFWRDGVKLNKSIVKIDKVA